MDEASAETSLVSALADASDATMLCGLASEGWYALKEAAERSGEASLAGTAIETLDRLGYSLEPGEEGQRAEASGGEAAKRYDPWGRLIA